MWLRLGLQDQDRGVAGQEWAAPSQCRPICPMTRLCPCPQHQCIMPCLMWLCLWPPAMPMSF